MVFLSYLDLVLLNFLATLRGNLLQTILIRYARFSANQVALDRRPLALEKARRPHARLLCHSKVRVLLYVEWVVDGLENVPAPLVAYCIAGPVLGILVHAFKP